MESLHSENKKHDVAPKPLIAQPTYDLGFFVRERGVEEDFFDAQGVARGHDNPRGRHRRLPIFLLQAVSNHQEGSQTNIHPLPEQTQREDERYDGGERIH